MRQRKSEGCLTTPGKRGTSLGEAEVSNDVYFNAEKIPQRFAKIYFRVTKEDCCWMQKSYCNEACVEKFLKARGNNVKKAAKQLRTCLTWRDGIRIEQLIADEFSSELAEGIAFIAGRDEERRPVVIVRMKQDYQKFQSQKLTAKACPGWSISRRITLPYTCEWYANGGIEMAVTLLCLSKVQIREKGKFLVVMSNPGLTRLVHEVNKIGVASDQLGRYVRLLVFTLEVAVASMLPGVDQCVLLFDAGYFRSGSTCLSLILATLKIFTDYYPGRLAKAFVIDPPSVFGYLWKGVRPFIDSTTNLSIVSSQDYDSPFLTSGFVRASSLRHDFTPNLGSSFRFSCKVVSENAKPSVQGFERDRYLAHSLGPALISPFNARSFSFASPATTRYHSYDNKFGDFQSFRAEDTPSRINSTPTQNINTPSRCNLTPTHNYKASILSSPMEGITSFFNGFKKEHQRIESDRKEKTLDCFRPYLRYYRLHYDEIAYRSMMKPPLGGLVSIVSPELKRRPSSDFGRKVYL
eukprot:Gb_01699 [translate_table: standard]